MTDDDISELFSRLETRLVSPAPEAIREEAARRHMSRRRLGTAAGAAFVIAAIFSATFWFARDTTTRTSTASDGVGNSAVSPTTQRPGTTRGTVFIDGRCSNGSRLTLDGSEWLPRSLPILWKDQNSVSVDVLIEGNMLMASDDDGNSATFRRHSPNEIVLDICIGWLDQADVIVPESAADSVDLLRNLGPLSVLLDFSEEEPSPFYPRTEDAFVSFQIRWTEPSGQPDKTGMWFSDGCNEDAYRIEWAASGFTVHEQAFVPSYEPATEDARCRPSSEQQVLQSQIGPGQFVAVAYEPSTNTFTLRSDEAPGRPWVLVLEGPPIQASITPTSTPPTTGPPPDVLPRIDARSVDDCIAGFRKTADESWRINGPDEDETAWAIFQAADDWEGRTDVCWISISTDSGCRSYAWFRTLGIEPGKFQEDPPLNADARCVGHGEEFR